MNPLPLYLAEITDGMVVAICGVVTTLILQFFVVLMFVLKSRTDDRHRSEDKVERAVLATLTKLGLDATAAGIAANTAAGGERESRIITRVAELEGKADAAYVAGNGNQEKFVEVAKRLEELSSAPTKVEIISDAKSPIHTISK